MTTATVRRRLAAALCLAPVVLLAGCGPGTESAAGGGAHHLGAVAGENTWGSLLAQVGGDRVSVRSVVTDPNADPHDYQSSASTARAFATADYVFLNGAGYDAWADQLLGANRSSSRLVRTLAEVAGRRPGDNPHMWYSPTLVDLAVQTMTADLTRIDPADGAYFAQRRAMLVAALQPYHDHVSAIRTRHHGVPVAATESVFLDMAAALGLDVVTPPDFMKAVSEGNDPPAATVSTFTHQLETRSVAVLVVNRQTTTAVTTTLEGLARAHGIPVVGVTETAQPADAPFQQWMGAQLDSLDRALAGAGT